MTLPRISKVTPSQENLPTPQTYIKQQYIRQSVTKPGHDTPLPNLPFESFLTPAERFSSTSPSSFHDSPVNKLGNRDIDIPVSVLSIKVPRVAWCVVHISFEWRNNLGQVRYDSVDLSMMAAHTLFSLHHRWRHYILDALGRLRYNLWNASCSGRAGQNELPYPG